MKKIMFNDRYGLTQAVIEGRKTMTRRIEFNSDLQQMVTDSDSYYYDDGYLVFATQDVDIHYVKTRYKVGEVVAVAQSYRDVCAGGFEPDATILRLFEEQRIAGWTNKMFTKAELMPYQIRITGIKCERLYDISEADCLKEGVRVEFVRNDVPRYYYLDFKRQIKVWFDTPREAFASLIDRVSGLGTWQRNPWVVVYEFELVK